MEIKDLILQSEKSLPTLEQNASTATVSVPTITADASTYWKFGGSAVMGIAGMLYLGYGKKTNDVQAMIIGVLLTIGSMFIF